VTRHAALAALVVLLATGCPSGGGERGPPALRYGEDACDECHMLINEARYAAAYATPAGEERRFDDVGDLLAYQQRTGEEAEGVWVHDLDDAGWVAARDARFVKAPDVTTPMGSGIVAFRDPARARSFAAQHGVTAVTFEELRVRGADGPQPSSERATRKPMFR
jgi:copper chaperone NosL